MNSKAKPMILSTLITANPLTVCDRGDCPALGAREVAGLLFCEHHANEAELAIADALVGTEEAR